MTQIAAGLLDDEREIQPIRGYRALVQAAGHIVTSDRRAQIGVFILLVAAFVAIAGPLLAPYPVAEPHPEFRFHPPSLAFPMGTDQQGRDVFSRVISGLTVSLMVAAGAVAVAFFIGVPIGAASAFIGGKVDSLLMRIMDAVIAMPGRLLAIAIVAAAGPSVTALWFAIAFSSIPRYARLIRGGVLAQQELEYVEAATSIGEKRSSILFRYVLPNSMAGVMVQVTLNFGQAIIAEASLSFLGLGLVPPIISWGQMLSAAQDFLEIAWWLAVFPGVALAILILGFVLLGDALRDHLDPRYRGTRRRRGFGRRFARTGR